MNCQDKLNIPQPEIQDILPMINADRFRNRLNWLDIGSALYSGCNGAKEGLEIWIESSRNAFITGGVPDFICNDIDATCKKFYCKFDITRTTVKTLGWYARKDSPDNYALWHNAWCHESICKAISRPITHVLDALYRMLWLDYCYCRRDLKWYTYQQHRWVQLSGTQKLSEFYNTTFISTLTKLMKNSTNISDFKVIYQLISRLKSPYNRTIIIGELKNSLWIDYLESPINRDVTLTATNTGIFELVGGKIVFRDGKPEDYISLSTYVDYNPLLTREHPLVQKCNSWFHEAFDDIPRYRFLNLVANSLFRGKLSDLSLDGNGSNSITCLKKLCCETFGDYCQFRDRDSRRPRSRLNIFFEPGNAKNTIQCSGTWVSNTTQLDKHSQCYLADPFFYDQVPSLAPAFLWILAHEYPNLQQRVSS